MITEKEYNNSDIVGFLVWEHEQEKIMAAHGRKRTPKPKKVKKSVKKSKKR